MTLSKEDQLGLAGILGKLVASYEMMRKLPDLNEVFVNGARHALARVEGDIIYYLLDPDDDTAFREARDKTRNMVIKFHG